MKKLACLLALVAGAIGCDGASEDRTVPLTQLVQTGQQADGLPILTRGETTMITEAEALEIRQGKIPTVPTGSAAYVYNILYAVGCNTQPWSYDGEMVCRSGTSYTGECVAIRASNNGGAIDLTELTYPNSASVNDNCWSWEANSMWADMLVAFHPHVWGSNPNPGARYVAQPDTIMTESWSTYPGTSMLIIAPLCPTNDCN